MHFVAVERVGKVVVDDVVAIGNVQVLYLHLTCTLVHVCICFHRAPPPTNFDKSRKAPSSKVAKPTESNVKANNDAISE